MAFKWKAIEAITTLWRVTKRFSSNAVSISDVIVEVQIILRYLGKKEKDEVQTMKNE